MPTKKSKLDAAVRGTAAIIEDHLGSLPPAEAKAMLRDIHHWWLSLSAPQIAENF
jgi:hypothetical protein